MNKKRLRKMLLYQEYILFCLKRELGITKESEPMDNPIMKFFAYDHLPDKLKEISAPFGVLARQICDTVPESAEKSAGLRKLLEAKDCIVRAAL